MLNPAHIDPRAKFLGIGIVSMLPLLYPSAGTILSGVAYLTLIAALLKVPFLRIIRRTGKVTWFAGTIILLRALTEDGSVIFRFGNLMFTMEGLLRGLELTACLVILLWGSTLLLWSTSPEQLVAGFEEWLKPLRTRFGPLIVLLTVTMNVVPLMILQARQLAFSFRSRGIDIDSRMTKRIRFFAGAAIPLFASSSRSASQLAVAMESRGYDPSTERSCYTDLIFKICDWVFLIGSIALASGSLLLSR